jgi:rhomboid family GlyGly-CTERM serine protease
VAAKVMRPGNNRIPWVTALVAVLALVAWIAPALSEAWVLDRDAVLRGEVWRLWTGHLVHFSTGHLGWNLLVVVCVGIWIERAGFRGGRWLWLIAPPWIGLVILAGEPHLRRYGGLSGLATAGIVFAGLSELRGRGSLRILGGAMVALVGLKIGWEFLSGNSVFAHFEGGNVRVDPLSHLAGAGTAFIAAWVFQNRRNRGEVAARCDAR